MIKLKSPLVENAEEIHYEDEKIDFKSESGVDAVFLIYTANNFWVLYKNKGMGYYPYTSDNKITIKLKAFEHPPTHDKIHFHVISKVHDFTPTDYANEVSGRIWNVAKYNETVVSFWNDMKDITSPFVSRRLFDMLTSCGYDYTKLLYEFALDEGIFYKYDKKLFVPSEEDTAKEKEANRKKLNLQHLLHTMDPAIKKRLMHMPDIDKKGRIAAELGFRTAAELDNYLNRGGE